MKGDYTAYIDARTGESVSGAYTKAQIAIGVNAKYFIPANPQNFI